MLAHPVSWLLFGPSPFCSGAGGLRAVAQIEDGAVGLGMTTFVSKVQSITERQRVQHHACTLKLFLLHAGSLSQDPVTCIPALTTLVATVYIQSKTTILIV